MIKSLKRLFVLVLAVVLLCISDNALAYSGSDYTTNSSLAKKLDKLINGEVAIFYNTSAKFPVGSSLDNSKTYLWGKDGYYGGQQCYAYAQAAYYYLFGDVPYHGGGGYSNSKVVSGVKGLKNLSYKVLSEAGVGCGAYIRTTVNSNGSYHSSNAHSMIILTYDSSSITILHGNANGNGLVRINNYSWSSFNNSHLSGRSTPRYVAHIVQPNLTADSIKDYTTIDSTPRIAKSIKDSTAADTCRLQSMPYDAEQYYTGKLEKGTIVYLTGAVKNNYNNTWYKTEDGKFIYSGDLEILEDNITNKGETAYSAVGVSKNKDCYLKDKAYEASAHSATVAKGKTVEIVAKVVNYHGNTWYKTSTGKYVYSGDVKTYACTELFKLSAKFTNTEKRDSHVAPYVDSADATTYKKNAAVTVTRFVTNSHGNIWAQLSDGSYLCFYDFDSKENKLTFVSTDITTSGVTGPTGNRELTASCNLKGKITAGTPILTMTGYVKDRNTGTKVVPAVVVEMKNGVKTADIDSTKNTQNSERLNYLLKFEKITKAGYYCYEVTVQLGFTNNGKTFKFGGEQVAVSMNFTAGNPSEDETPKDDSTNASASGITMSAGSGLTGTVGSTVTVPISINNPNNVALGVIALDCDLPEGVTVSKVVVCGKAADASVIVGNPILVNEMSTGITGSGKILEVTLAFDSTAVLPANIKITPTVNTLSPETECTLDAFTVTVANASGRIPGDVNVDGKVTTSDFLRLGKYLAGWKNITINSSNADVTGDGKVTTSDFLRLGKYLAGWKNITLE